MVKDIPKHVRIMKMSRSAYLVLMTGTLLVTSSCQLASASQVRVELVAPRWVVQSNSVTFRCIHDVASHQLYKLEFMKAGVKILQYVRERKPQFTAYPIQGAVLNMTLVTENSITLEDLDFSASGQYTCEVSLETPIYTKSSNNHELTVIKPQRHAPRIRFDRRVYRLGDLLTANCTSSPAHPAPHITWLINDEKVDESLTKPFVSIKHPRGSPPIAVSAATLTIPVALLPADGTADVRLTCISTIPSYITRDQTYVDIKTHSVIVEVFLLTAPPAASEASSSKIEPSIAAAPTSRHERHSLTAALLTIITHLLITRILIRHDHTYTA